MKNLRILKYLLEKEFKQIKRDKFLPRIIFVIPMIQLLLLPFAADFEMKNININIVDNDHSEYSHRLTEKILSSRYFRAATFSTAYPEALRTIENDEADLILEIPCHFGRDLLRETHAPLSIVSNAVNGTKGGLGSSYLLTIIRDFSFEIEKERNTRSVEAPIEITTVNRFNPHLDYKYYMVPGIMVFLLTIISCFLPAMNIVSEKEKGTIEQMNVSPVPRAVFILSKLLPFWIIGFILLTLSIAVAYFVYGLIPVGNPGILYLFAAIYILTFTGLGLGISSLASTIQQAMFGAFFFFIIFVLMSGLFTPISSMPPWAQTLTLFNPLRYAVEVIRSVYLKGSGLADLLPQFGAILLFAFLFNLGAILTYKKNR